MRLAALLTPVADWPAVADAARAADRAGFDAVGFWDHYHSGQPDWAYICGWSAMGAVAASTEHVRLLPMVLNAIHYEPGVLAKESSILAGLSDGRFELGIGAGDWPASFAAWGRPFPPVDDRLDVLVETIEALRLVWGGDPVDYAGRFVRLEGAICTPPPPRPPRVVVGVGGSRRTMARLLHVADEINIYADAELARDARAALAAQGPDARSVALSVFLSWEWDKWPADPASELDEWAGRGIDRACVSIGGADMLDRIRILAAWQEASSTR